MRSLSKSKIIKNHGAASPVSQFDIFFSEDRSIEDSHIQKRHQTSLRHMKVKAQEEAQRIINEAKKQSVIEQQSGFEEGLRNGLEKIKPLEEQLRRMIEEMESFKKVYLKHLEPEAVNMIINICNKIIKDKLEHDRKIVIRNVRAVFKELTDKECIKIRIHADDVVLMHEFKPQLLEMFHDIQKLEIVADEHVDRGGCIIETNEGSVDATIKTQMKKLNGLITCETFASQLQIAS